MVIRTRHSLGALALAAQALVGLIPGGAAAAAPRDQAHQMFNRINSVPPTPAALDAMTAKITAGDAKGAALLAIDDASGNFYNVTLRDLVARWTNVDGTPRVPLNDYTATVIGMIRDDVPFNTVLSGDVVYVADPAKVPGVPAYSWANNAHYQFLDQAGVDLHTVLVQEKQTTSGSGVPADGVAGVMSTRGFAEAYYKDGTNRRAFSFTLQTFLCKNMNQLSDTTIADFHVRRDVTRQPGGDSAVYRNKCAGCHAGMDAMAGAFTSYDVKDGATPDADTLVYQPGVVPAKFNRNADQFPQGFVTTDDSWTNLWVSGQNAALGWHGATSGAGAQALGQMLTDTDAFASCMASYALTTMCLHAPTTAAETAAVGTLAAEFKKDWNMKNVFAEAAVTCTEE